MQLLPNEFAVNIQMKQQFYREQKYHAVELHESYQSIKIFFMSLHMQPAWVRHVTLTRFLLPLLKRLGTRLAYEL